MPGLATFDPQGGGAMQSFRAFGEGQSLMDRADEQKRQDEIQAIQKQQMLAQLPVIIAKAHADTQTQTAAIANSAIMQQRRADAAAASVDANKEFQDTMQIADWGERADALSKVKAKYSWMEVADPVYKGFLDEVGKQSVQAAAARNLDETFINNQQLAEEKAQAAAEMAQVKAENDQLKAAATQAEITKRAELSSTTSMRNTDVRTQASVDAAKERASKPYEIGVAKERYDQAVKEGDQESATIWWDRIQKINNISGQDVQPMPKAPPASIAKAPPAAAAPASVAPPVSISTKEQFDALPAGAPFIFNGKPGIKK